MHEDECPSPEFAQRESPRLPVLMIKRTETPQYAVQCTHAAPASPPPPPHTLAAEGVIRGQTEPYYTWHALRFGGM